MLFYCAWTIVIASAVVMLAWVRQRKKERKSEDTLFSNLSIWYFSDALQQKVTIPLLIEVLENDIWVREAFE